MIERWERRFRGFVVVAAFVGLLYLGDWVVLEIRVAHGTAYRVVQVTQFLATQLKGKKVEYDMMGTFQETCTRSIFPQNGDSPCWWLEKHTSQWK